MMQIPLRCFVIFVLLIGTLSGCSTVDKRVYFRVESVGAGLSHEGRQLTSREMGCPILAIPLSPNGDLVKGSLKLGSEDFQINLNFGLEREFDSYWWGPLWVPVVPIFLFESETERNAQFIISIRMRKSSFKTVYDHKDKSTWQGRKDEVDQTVFPKVKNVTATYRDQSNKEVVQSGVYLQNFSSPHNRFNFSYSFDLSRPMPERFTLSIEVEDQKFELKVVKNQNWAFRMYLVGCFP